MKKKTDNNSEFFRGMIDELKNLGTKSSLASDGDSSAEFSGTIDTGCYILNAAISGSIWGGVPNNKVTAFVGEPSAGKTYYILGIVQKFLESNPTGGCIYYDTESAVTKQMMTSRNIDTSRVIIVEPETIQQFRHHVLKLLDNYMSTDESNRPPMIIALDSLGMLSTTKEMEDSTEGKDTRDMTKAQVIKAAFRTITLKLAKAKVPMLVSNHVYEVVGSYFPTKEISGGGGLKYAASTICMLAKSKDKDSDKNVIGAIIKVKMYKSRLSKENVIVETKLNYNSGLDRYYGLLDVAVDAGIVKKVSTQYQWPDGTKSFEKHIYKNPEKYFTKEVLNQIEVEVNKQFRYGQISDEQLLVEDI